MIVHANQRHWLLNRNLIIGITGRIGSGKSTLARALAVHLSAKSVSFGDYIRHLAALKHIAPSDRPALQALGQAMVAGNAEAFVTDVLAWSSVQLGENLVLDGIRHAAVWEAVRSVAASRHQSARLIFLEMPEGERQARIASRGLTLNESLIHDRHESEKDVGDSLRKLADVRVVAQEDQVPLIASIVMQLGVD